MKTKILIPIVLAIFVLVPMPAHAQENAIGNFMDSVGYAVDSIVDSVRLFFTFDSKAKADLNMEIANKKIDQISELSKKGNENLAETVKSDYENTINEIKNAVTKNETIKSELAEDVIEHKAKASSAKIRIEVQSGSNAPMKKLDEKASELSSLVKASNASIIDKAKVSELLEEFMKDLLEFVNQSQQNQSQFQLLTQQYSQYVGLLFTQTYAHGGIAEAAFNQGNYLDAYEETLIARNLFSEVKIHIKQAKEKEKELATKPVILVQPPNIHYFDEMKAEINITNIGGKPLIINDVSCKVCIIDFTKGTALNQGESVTVFVKFTEKVGSNYGISYEFLKISSNDREVKIPLQYAIVESVERSLVTPVSYDDDYYDISKLPYDASNYEEAVKYWSQFPNVRFECINGKGEPITKSEYRVLCTVYNRSEDGSVSTISYETYLTNDKTVETTTSIEPTPMPITSESKSDKDVLGEKELIEKSKCINSVFTASFDILSGGVTGRKVTVNYVSGASDLLIVGMILYYDNTSTGYYSYTNQEKILRTNDSETFNYMPFHYTPKYFEFFGMCEKNFTLLVTCIFTGNYGTIENCSSVVKLA